MSAITKSLPNFTKSQNIQDSSQSILDNTALICCICGVALISAIILLPELSHAATKATEVIAGEAELDKAFTNIKGLVSGVVGKIVTIVALGFGLAGSIFKFNPAAIAGSFGVALTAAFGPSAVTAIVGATF